MSCYDQITSRDPAAFPFQAFLGYPRLLMVDWREEERRILSGFFKATGLSREGIDLEWDEPLGRMIFVHPGGRIELARGDGTSAQHSMLMALQQVYGASHPIRCLSYEVAAGDTGYFFVEERNTWARLEQDYPLVRWFFTPIELLPDTFEGDHAALREAARRYAEAGGTNGRNQPSSR